MEEVSLISLTDDVAIDINQMPTVDGIRLVIDLHTVNDVECSNTDFSYELYESDGLVSLDLYDLVTDGICDDLASNVSTRVQFKQDYSNATFELLLKSTVKNLGSLQLKDQSYHLEFESQNGFLLNKASLNKIQPNTVWGQIFFDNHDYYSNHSSKVWDILESVKDTSYIPKNGDYGLFTCFNGDFFFEGDDTNTISFMFKYTDWQLLKIQLGHYLSELDKVTFKISNDRAESL